MIWSTALLGLGAKEGAGFTRSFLTVRRYEDWFREKTSGVDSDIDGKRNGSETNGLLGANAAIAER